MKPQILFLTAVSALTGCTPQTPATVASAAVPLVTEAGIDRSKPSSDIDVSNDFSSVGIADNRYEVIYSGAWPGSRDQIEGRLLYRAALTARGQGKAWFRFLHLPGEDGPMSHPSRPSPSFGAAFGHWQPHWNYWTAWGWQLWHPERGHAFWGDTVDGKGVERVEVHAMIELGDGPFAAAEQTDFAVSAVLRDLPPTFH